MGEDNLFDNGMSITMTPVQATGMVVEPSNDASPPVVLTVGDKASETLDKPKRKGGWPKGKPRGPRKAIPTVDEKPNLGVFKVFKDSPDPVWATSGSACFDIKAYLKEGTVINGFLATNGPTKRVASFFPSFQKWGVIINPGERLLIPTGLIFDIPEGYSIRIHPRSGMSLKQGFTLANAEGIIDWDYVEQSFTLLLNASHQRQRVYDGERIAQGELIVAMTQDKFNITNLKKAPERKTTRKGGFGHTGNN